MCLQVKTEHLRQELGSAEVAKVGRNRSVGSPLNPKRLSPKPYSANISGYILGFKIEG